MAAWQSSRLSSFLATSCTSGTTRTRPAAATRPCVEKGSRDASAGPAEGPGGRLFCLHKPAFHTSLPSEQPAAGGVTPGPEETLLHARFRCLLHGLQTTTAGVETQNSPQRRTPSAGLHQQTCDGVTFQWSTSRRGVMCSMTVYTCVEGRLVSSSSSSLLELLRVDPVLPAGLFL